MRFRGPPAQKDKVRNYDAGGTRPARAMAKMDGRSPVEQNGYTNHARARCPMLRNQLLTKVAVSRKANGAEVWAGMPSAPKGGCRPVVGRRLADGVRRITGEHLGIVLRGNTPRSRGQIDGPIKT